RSGAEGVGPDPCTGLLFERAPSHATPSRRLRSPLRRELVVEDLRVVDSQLDLPTKPGLGIELNRDALRKYGRPTLGRLRVDCAPARDFRKTFPSGGSSKWRV